MRQSNSDGLRPEDFPLGSPESRAAARVVLEARKEERPRAELISNVNLRWDGPDWNKVPYAEPWMEGERRTFFRTVYIPTLWKKAPYSGEVPCCPACSTPYQRYDDWKGWVLFEASCLENHTTSQATVSFGCGPTPLPETGDEHHQQ